MRIFLVFLLGALVSLSHAASLVSAEEVSKDKSSRLILDVRNADEFAAGHLPGAINIPHDRVTGDDPRLKDWKDKPVLVYCRSGRRSGLVADKLEQAGFSKIQKLEGDLPGWEAKGYPVER